jgi:hypothetical protein
MFKNSFYVPVPRTEFSKKFYFPNPEYSKIVRCTCSQTGVFRESFLSQPVIISDFRAFPSKKKLAGPGYDPLTFRLLRICLTSTPPVLIEELQFFVNLPRTVF